MASVFGIAGLKSRLSDWRGLRKSSDGDGASGPLTLPAELRDDGDRGLSMVLENLVIPKLIAGSSDTSRRGALPRKPRPRWCAITAADVDAFTTLCVREDAPHLLDFVDRFIATGHSVETIYIDLLAPAARRLGQHWEDDSQDFVDVTMGLWRIQEVLRELTVRTPPSVARGRRIRTALFSTMPGEQHSFGTLMVAECFERAGWQTDVLIEPTASELTGKFARQSYDLIGLTVSCDCSSAALSGLVTSIRTVSVNPQVKVLVGGRAINLQPDLVAQCAADGTAIDAAAAVALADQLVPVRQECLDDLA